MKRTGTSGNDTIRGGIGDDELYGRGGDDWLQGGAGDDELFGEAGDDRLEGGAGHDQLRGGQGNDALLGGNGNDKLWGGIGDDSLDGGYGNDTLNGGEGNDVLTGGDGADRAVFTGARADYVISWIDATHVLVTDLRAAGDGADTLTLDIEQVKFSDGLFALADLLPPVGPTDGDDVIEGTDGADEINALGGNDVINAGDGNDTVDGGDGSDSLVLAGSRADYNVAYHGSFFVVYNEVTTETDWLFNVESIQFGDGSTFTLADLVPQIGTDGDDTLLGTDWYDELSGLGGNDTMFGGGGNDSLYGGDGADTAVLTGSRADYEITYLGSSTFSAIDLRAGSPDGWKSLFGVEFLQFADGSTFDLSSLMPAPATEGDDVITGTGSNDQIDALGGNDQVSGGDGADYLDGGEGNDTIEGGDGADQLLGGNGDDQLYAGFGDMLVSGGDGWDQVHIYGSFESADTTFESIETFNFYGSSTMVDLSAYGQTAYVLAFGDTIDFRGTAFDDYVSMATTEHSTVYGGAGNDALFSGDGNDWLFGEAGDDQLYGSQGHDLLVGSDGNDVIEGGLGSDTLNGGAGIDTFAMWMKEAGAVDVIQDFEVGMDRISIRSQGLSYSNLQIADIGTGTTVTYGTSTVYLEGVQAMTINASSFDILG